METTEGSFYLVESERDREAGLSKGVVWILALAFGLIVDIGLVASAVQLVERLWA